ncbi:LRRN4 C-terminal-like protein-like [Arapaima gigas]
MGWKRRGQENTESTRLKSKGLSDNMTPHRNPSLLLVLLASGLFEGYGKDTAMQDPPRDRFRLKSNLSNSELCDYDACQDQQPPCVELSESSGCRCPGLSGPEQLPEAPFLQPLGQEGPKVVVQWCAPSSTVLQYQVHVDGHKLLDLGPLSRRASLPTLEPGATVCVKAVNQVGASKPTPNSCTRYEALGDSGVALKAGLIGGGVGLLLLLSLLGLLLWKWRAGRKFSPRGPADNTERPL